MAEEAPAAADAEAEATGTTDLAPAFRLAAGHFATGVTVVTSLGPTGTTVNAVCSLSLHPPRFLVCFDRASRTLAAVRASHRLAVNVLAGDQRALAVRFAWADPEVDKFEGVGYRPLGGLPVLDGAVAWMAGEVREILPGGDHEIAIVEAESLGAPGGKPLLFHAGEYRGG